MLNKVVLPAARWPIKPTFISCVPKLAQLCQFNRKPAAKKTPNGRR
jgi:hypothetical protein